MIPTALHVYARGRSGTFLLFPFLAIYTVLAAQENMEGSSIDHLGFRCAQEE